MNMGRATYQFDLSTTGPIPEYWWVPVLLATALEVSVMFNMLPARGEFESDEAALDAVVKRLVERLNPLAIFLFGSRARGEHRDNSDFDLLVITRVEDSEAGRDYTRPLRAIADLGVDAEIVPVRYDDLDAELNSDISMIPDIMGYAEELYRESSCPPIPRSGSCRA